jgi:hypothetical protein
MKKLSKLFTLACVLVLLSLSPLHAQTTTNAPADATAATSVPTQAPDDVTNKITNLVHDGKYVEAQQLTTGLLLAYPDDQRLIKAKALLDKMLDVASAQPTANPNAQPLAGMDKVDYDALIELAKQARQTTDLEQQNTLLLQFMDQSSLFLSKYPTAMLLWQLRAAAAINLNDPAAGYEAGQSLLNADSNDANVRRLLAQLKNKGWLDKQGAESQAKYGWILGTWSVSWSLGDENPSHKGERGFGGGSQQTPGSNPVWAEVAERRHPPAAHGNYANEVFRKSGSVIEGYNISDSGVRSAEAVMRGTILDSGEISWERYFSPSGEVAVSDHSVGNNARLVQVGYREIQAARGPKALYPNGWQPVISFVVGEHKATMTMVVPSQSGNSKRNPVDFPITLLFTKIGGAQSE